MKRQNDHLYVRGPHIKYIIMATSMGFGIVMAIAAIFIIVLSL